MRYIKKYNEEITISEIFNFKQIKDNDKLVKAIIDEIYSDYEKVKNLMACKMITSDRYWTFWYKISDNKYTQATTSGGDEKYKEIKITLEKSILNPKCFIEVDVHDKLGIGNHSPLYWYLPNENSKVKRLQISLKIGEKLIKFFKSEYNKKYPDIKGPYFNYNKILEVDKELESEIRNTHLDKRKKHEELFNKAAEEADDIIDKYSKFTIDDIKDYFIELDDLLKEEFRTEFSCVIFQSYEPHLMGYTTIGSSAVKYHTVLNSLYKYNIKPNNIYYLVNYKLTDENRLWDDDEEALLSDISKSPKLEKLKISDFLSKNYNLSSTSNGTFRVAKIATSPTYTHDFNLSILLEQV